MAKDGYGDMSRTAVCRHWILENEDARHNLQYFGARVNFA